MAVPKGCSFNQRAMDDRGWENMISIVASVGIVWRDTEPVLAMMEWTDSLCLAPSVLHPALGLQDTLGRLAAWETVSFDNV